MKKENKVESFTLEEKNSQGTCPPYVLTNPVASIIEGVRCGTQGLAELRIRSVVICLDSRLRDKDIAAAIAFRHFLEENGVPAIIHADPDEVGYRTRIRDAEKEVTLSLPEDDFSYYAVLIGVSKNEYLEDRTIDRTYMSFSFCGDSDAVPNVAALSKVDRDTCSTVSVLYPCIKEACSVMGYRLSRRVITEFYAAIQYSLVFSRRISIKKVFDVYGELLADGADYVKVEEEMNSLPKMSLSFVKLLVEKLEFRDGIATARISHSDLAPFQSLSEKKQHAIYRAAVQTFRYLEDVDAWCIFIEEVENQYYTVLQSKNSLPFNMENIAKRNNGFGTKTDAVCLIYGFDLDKVFKNLRDHVRSKKQKSEEAE